MNVSLQLSRVIQLLALIIKIIIRHSPSILVETTSCILYRAQVWSYKGLRLS